MFLSAKYVVLYAGAGMVTGFVSKGNKTAMWVGMGIAALVGASFGLGYAAVSAIEFTVGFGVSLMFQSNK
jgi:hypothetical protein